jgi:hypothetical protein
MALYAIEHRQVAESKILVDSLNPQKRQFLEFEARGCEANCNKVDDHDIRLLAFRLAGNRGFQIGLRIT